MVAIGTVAAAAAAAAAVSVDDEVRLALPGTLFVACVYLVWCLKIIKLGKKNYQKRIRWRNFTLALNHRAEVCSSAAAAAAA